MIVPDPDNAHTIKRLFEQFASGEFSLKELTAHAHKEGITLRNARIQKSTLHQILRKRLYSGDFDFNGQTYRGTYEPLVARETWERVQSVLVKHGSTNRHRIKHDFSFSGLVRCGYCNCMLVAEVKKGRYIYYHCTGQRGKCHEPYTREESLVKQFAGHLSELVIPQEVLAWLQASYAESDLTERAARERTIKQQQAQYDRLQSRMEVLYNDRLDGRISPTFYDQKAAEIHGQQQAILRKIEEITSSEPAPVQEAVDFMRLASNAAALFVQQDGHEQRRLLRTLLKSAAWQNSELRVEFEEPFQTLRDSNRLSKTKDEEIGMKKPETEIWLPGMDSNHDSRLQRPLSYH